MANLFRKSQSSLFWGGLSGFLILVFSMGRGGQIGKNLFLFGTLYVLSFLLLGVLVKTFPGKWPVRRQFILVFALAILCRVFFLSFPVSYDVNRYIWEGQVFNQGYNPYLHAPNDPILRPLVNDIWQHINHKDASASYPPLAILVFCVSAWIWPSTLFFKIVVILLDLGAILVLAKWIHSKSLSPSRLLLYALNPLVLVFIAGEAHMDSMQVFPFASPSFFFTERGPGGDISRLAVRS